MSRRYEVVGPVACKGVEPGGVVEYDDEALEAHLVGAGHLKPVSKSKKASEES